MKFSLSWLKQHLETTANIDEIVAALVAVGIEVEHVDDPSERLKGLVVGYVKTCERHPNADRLSVCTIEDGTITNENPTTYQVVCGAPNVRAHMKVAFAPAGTIIPNTGLPLKKGNIRGIESHGMLCSSRELLIGDDSDGIMDLDPSFEMGASLAKSLELDDPIIDVSLTPNRSDCFSVYGIARDLAAFGIGTLKEKPMPDIKTSGSCDVSLTISDPNTYHFAIRTIKGVKNNQSPDWVQKRLRSAGCRPISALVDATNFVCLEFGRPLHVFDKNKLLGATLNVHESHGGELFEGLNEKQYTLSKGMTVISDASGVISLAGIMGGTSTGCDSQTTDVVLESALFNPAHIALTGQSTAILSDARTRFERGVDANDVLFGLDYATQLILEWCGGSASDIIQVGPNTQKKPDSVVVTLTRDRFQSLSGIQTVSVADMVSLLEKLGFTISASSDKSLSVVVPSHRHDIGRDVDLIEEILRLKGYDNIPDAPLPLVLSVDTNNTRERLSTFFTNRGYNEAYTWSFVPNDTAALFGKGIALSKPLNSEMAILRSSVLAGLLKIAAHGQKRSQPNSAFFEYAPQFHEIDGNLIETLTFSGLRVFSKSKRHWQKTESALDVYRIKNDMTSVLECFGLGNTQIDSNTPSYYHPGRSATIKQGPKTILCFGEIHPKVLKEMDVNGTVIGFEIFIDALPFKQKDKRTTFNPAIYQSVSRDFAFWVDLSITSEQLIKIIQKVDRELIESIHVFDVYTGDKAPMGKKSLAIEVMLQPKKQTLNDDDLMNFQNKVIADVEKLCGGRIRDAA